MLEKLVEVDVRTRGCTLIALLPNLHERWHGRFVGSSHEVHHLVGQLVFQNPLRNRGVEKKGYLWESRAYILVVWRPSSPPPQPAGHYAHLRPSPPASAERIRLRACCACGRVRVLPRWANPKERALRPGVFKCASNPDRLYASCDVPEFVPVYSS